MVKHKVRMTAYIHLRKKIELLSGIKEILKFVLIEVVLNFGWYLSKHGIYNSLVNFFQYVAIYLNDQFSPLNGFSENKRS